jgi:hypothetical protein
MRTPNRVPPWRALLLVFVTNALDYSRFQFVQNVVAEDIITYGNQFTFNQENDSNKKKTKTEYYDTHNSGTTNDNHVHDTNIRKRKKPQHFTPVKREAVETGEGEGETGEFDDKNYIKIESIPSSSAKLVDFDMGRHDFSSKYNTNNNNHDNDNNNNNNNNNNKKKNSNHTTMTTTLTNTNHNKTKNYVHDEKRHYSYGNEDEKIYATNINNIEEDHVVSRITSEFKSDDNLSDYWLSIANCNSSAGQARQGT